MAPRPPDAASFLAKRLDFLWKTQNPDGGWGYFPGKQSWIEPTAWAAIALHGRPEATRAWERILIWQNPDGSWRPGPEVRVNSWATALCVTICHARGEFGEPYKRGLHWLLKTADADAALLWGVRDRIFSNGRNPDHKAWPWKPGNSFWIEPTAHSLVALKQARKRLNLPEIQDRITQGEAAILDQRCSDGGWNFGNTRVLDVDLPSYPETTALALVGLQQAGLQQKEVASSVAFAEKLLEERQGRMASAWLTIALRLHGRAVPEIPRWHPELTSTGDVLVAAFEAIGTSDRSLGVLRTGGGK